MVIGPLDLDLAPDYLHKADISGGAPYGIRLPNASADALFENEVHGLHFVPYLRLCFRWAGFPGLSVALPTPKLTSFLESMRRGLEPF